MGNKCSKLTKASSEPKLEYAASFLQCPRYGTVHKEEILKTSLRTGGSSTVSVEGKERCMKVCEKESRKGSSRGQGFWGGLVIKEKEKASTGN